MAEIKESYVISRPYPTEDGAHSEDRFVHVNTDLKTIKVQLRPEEKPTAAKFKYADLILHGVDDEFLSGKSFKLFLIANSAPAAVNYVHSTS